MKLYQSGHIFAARGEDTERSGVGVIVPSGICVTELGIDLPSDVRAPSLGAEKSIVDTLRDGNIVSSDCTVLR
jgi:hypothetical protein